MTLEELEKESPLCIQLATSAWTKPNTSNLTMNTELAKKFAFILYEEIKKPNLGNATTRELLEELKSRTRDTIVGANFNVILRSLEDEVLNYKTTNYK